MNRILIAAFTAALLCGSLLAQSTQSPSTESAPEQPQQIPTTEQPAAPSTPTQAAPTQSTPANSAPRIAPGSVIPARLSKSIDAKKAKKGDEVVATVTQDMKNNAGTVLVPKDTKIIGHVTEAQARSKEQKESEIAIAFDRAVPKNGEPMQMPMSIQAIIAPPDRNAANAEQPSSNAGSGTGGTPAYGGGRSGSMGGSAQAPSAPQ